MKDEESCDSSGGRTVDRVFRDELRWERVRSDAVEPQRLRIEPASDQWKVTRCPWWLDARRESDELVLRVRHCGRHRGKVWLGSNAGSASIRVQADVVPAREHGRAAKRHGLYAAVLLASALFIPPIAVTVITGREQLGWAGVSFACWLPLAAVGFGWFLGSWKLAVRTALGVGAGVAVLSALIATEAHFMPRGGLLPRPGYHVPNGYYTGALESLNHWSANQLEMAELAILVPPHLLLFWAVWGTVVGGRRLAWKSALWGTLWSLPLVLPALQTGYAVVVMAPGALVLAAISWQCTLGGHLARIPYGEEVPALLARSAREGRWLWYMAGSLAALFIAACYWNSIAEWWMDLLRQLGIWY